MSGWLRPLSWRLPWWLNPWSALRTEVSYSASLERRIDSLCETAQQDIATIQELTSRNTALTRQVEVHTGVRTADGRPSTGRAMLGWDQPGAAVPEFVIVGLDRGAAGGKRIYVSRELGGASFGIEGASPTWNLRTAMANMLVIDKPTYGQALEQMAATWRNWDADAASPHRPTVRAALPEGSDPRD